MTVPARLHWLPAQLLVVLVTACASTGPVYQERVEILLLGIQPLAPGREPQRLDLMLAIRNPNATALPLDGLSYRVVINDREFAYGVSRQAATIPAHNEAVIDVEVAGSRLAGLRLSPASETGVLSRLAYRITGELDLADSTVRLPFDSSGTLDWQAATDDTAR